MLLLAALVVGYADHQRFSLRWLLVAALLVALNDVLLTRAYGLLPEMIGGSWNWQGKLLALCATLAIASLPAFGWRRAGFTLFQEPGSLRAAMPVAALYCAFFIAIALAFPGGPADVETAAFQLTMPGIEEELFYRGILLLALDQAFRGPKTVSRRRLGLGRRAVLFAVRNGPCFRIFGRAILVRRDHNGADGGSRVPCGLVASADRKLAFARPPSQFQQLFLPARLMANSKVAAL